MTIEAKLRFLGLSKPKLNSGVPTQAEIAEGKLPKDWPNNLKNAWEAHGLTAVARVNYIKSKLAQTPLTHIDEVLIGDQIRFHLTVDDISLDARLTEDDKAKLIDKVISFSSVLSVNLAVRGLEDNKRQNVHEYIATAGEVARCINELYKKYGEPNETAVKNTVPLPVRMMQLAKTE